MCGIIGYIGKENAIEKLHNGLKKLEYRGYDSAGISFFENNKLETIKKVGSVLEEILLELIIVIQNVFSS